MRLADALASLLECATSEIETPVCRTVTYPGANATHDSCEAHDGADGQLWVAHLGSQPGWPVPTGEPTTCATAWSERVEVGIVRCARGKVRDDGGPPDEDDVTADADQQETDRLALKRAILCCLAVDSKDLIVEGWDPIEPRGGCVGGTWTIVVRDSGCDCSQVS